MPHARISVGARRPICQTDGRHERAGRDPRDQARRGHGVAPTADAYGDPLGGARRRADPGVRGPPPGGLPDRRAPRRHRRDQAALAVEGRSGPGPRRVGHRHRLRGGGCDVPLGPHRRPLLRWLGRRPAGGARGGRSHAGAAQGLHHRRRPGLRDARHRGRRDPADRGRAPGRRAPARPARARDRARPVGARGGARRARDRPRARGGRHDRRCQRARPRDVRRGSVRRGASGREAAAWRC